jgi:hypothetical protein
MYWHQPCCHYRFQKSKNYEFGVGSNGKKAENWSTSGRQTHILHGDLVRPFVRKKNRLERNLKSADIAVGFEVITAVFYDVTPCSPLEVSALLRNVLTPSSG